MDETDVVQWRMCSTDATTKPPFASFSMIGLHNGTGVDPYATLDQATHVPTGQIPHLKDTACQSL